MLSFAFLDDFEGNANVSVAIKSISTVSFLLSFRYTGNSYTGSVEMKIVDSMPVIVDGSDMYNAKNYSECNSSIVPKRSKRNRTVSESAARPPVKPPMIDELIGHASSSSLRSDGASGSSQRIPAIALPSAAEGRARPSSKLASFSLGRQEMEK